MLHGGDLPSLAASLALAALLSESLLAQRRLRETMAVGDGFTFVATRVVTSHAIMVQVPNCTATTPWYPPWAINI